MTKYALLGLLIVASLACGCTSETPSTPAPEAAVPAPPDMDVPEGSFTLKVFPNEIELRGKGDRQDVVVQAIEDSGAMRDVTAKVEFQLAEPKAAIEGNRFTSQSDGPTKLVASYSGQQVEAPVTVKDAGKSRDVSFRLDVMPVFMKHGCNNGSCHGAARGKDGFMLSLFGYDIEGDYFRLTRQMVGRRIDLAVPEKSLLLEKAIGAVQHTGGKLFGVEHDDYKTLLSWIEAGAPNDSGNTPEPLGIEVMPPKMVFAGGGATQRTSVRAKYSDGSVRDVTRLALFMTNNDGVVQVSKEGVVKAGSRGGAFVFARFNKFTVGAEVIVLPTGDNFQWPSTPEQNYVDTLVFDKLKKLHLAPSELCTDEAFLRRATLDLIGLPPSREEYQKFMDDPSSDKRAKLVDSLLARDEFVDIWTMKWGEMLRIRSANNQPQYGRDAKAMWSYSAWVHDQMAQNRPLDQFVSELVVGKGSNIKSPASNLYTAPERLTPLKTAEDVAQVFMGTRIQCAQCHNHPFDRWTMDDYYSFAGFFAGLNMKRGIEGREVVVYNNNSRNTVDHPVDGRKMKPKFLGGDMPEVDDQDPRESLARWLTSPDNAAFNQTMANVVWAHFFGRGIVEPVDDVRISNPPSNRELLEVLGKKLAEYKFDKKKLIRDICNSRTYQLAATTNETNALDEAYFSHSYVRRLRAEVLLDTISKVTDTEERFPQSPPGTRATQLYSGNISNYFLTTFGRAPRETACSCEVNREANLSQALHLLNGDTITQKVGRSKLISTMIAEKKPSTEILTELYIRALSRKPTAEELKNLSAIIDEEIGDAEKLKHLAGLQAQADSNYRRYEDQLKKLKSELSELQSEGQEGAALKSLEDQIRKVESQADPIRQRFEGNVQQLVYVDVLWGLFNSTEFAFNH